MNPVPEALLAIGAVLLWLSVRAVRSRHRSDLRAEVLEIVATAARRDLPLVPALERMAQGARGATRTALEQLCGQLRDGIPVWQALDESLPHRTMPAFVISTLRSVEGTAGLRPALTSLAATKKRALRVRDRLRVALVYPSLLAILSVGLFVTTETLLDRDALAADGGAAGFANGAAANGTGANGTAANGTGAIVLGVALLLALAWYLARSRKQLRGLVERASAHMPWARRLEQEAAAGRMLRVAAHLTRAEVPLGTMLRRAAGAAENTALSRSTREAAEAADTGASAEEVWRTCGLPKHATARLALCASSQPAQLADRMLGAAEACERRVERTVDRAISVVQPAALVFFGTLIALHFASVFRYLDSARYAQGGLPW